jgi:hypothetical protein
VFFSFRIQIEGTWNSDPTYQEKYLENKKIKNKDFKG